MDKNLVIEKLKELVSNLTIQLIAPDPTTYKTQAEYLELRREENTLREEITELEQEQKTKKVDYHNDIFGPGNDNYGRDKPFWDKSEQKPDKTVEEYLKREKINPLYLVPSKNAKGYIPLDKILIDYVSQFQSKEPTDDEIDRLKDYLEGKVVSGMELSEALEISELLLILNKLNKQIK